MWISRWFYARTQLDGSIPIGFSTHVFVLRITGLWPMPRHDSPWYYRLTIAIFLLTGLIYPVSLTVNIFFANTIEEAMDHVFLSSTVWLTAIKAAVVYWRRDSIHDLFRIHVGLLKSATSNTDTYETVIRNNVRVHLAMATLYHLTSFVFVVQSCFSQREDSLWPSTLHFPYAFAQKRSVYWIVLVYQMICGQSITVWVAVQDAFFIALIGTVCHHVAQLKQRLRHLGGGRVDSNNDRDLLFYKGLVECCRHYEACLRCVSTTLMLSKLNTANMWTFRKFLASQRRSIKFYRWHYLFNSALVDWCCVLPSTCFLW